MDDGLAAWCGFRTIRNPHTLRKGARESGKRWCGTPGANGPYLHATNPRPRHNVRGVSEFVRDESTRVDSAARLATPAVAALIDAAIAQANVPLPEAAKGYTIVKSVSAKQRPRRKPA